MAQIYDITAFAVEIVQYLEFLASLLAFKGFCRGDDFTAFIFCCAEACAASGVLPILLGGGDLFPLRNMYLTQQVS